MANGVVIPVGCIGAVTGRKNGGTVFHGHTYDLGLEVGGKFQLVAYGGSHQIVRRHLAGAACGAYGLHVVVGAAIHLLVVNRKTIACNAVECRHRAGVNT